MEICWEIGNWDETQQSKPKVIIKFVFCVMFGVYTCRGPCISPTGFVHKGPRRWGDSEAQPGPSTEDWNACQLVKG